MKSILTSRLVAPCGRIIVLFAVLLGLASSASVWAQSLVFHYEFNETSGTAVSDSAGDYDLTLRSTTSWGPGVTGATGGLSLNTTALGVGTGAAATFADEGAAINLTQFTFTGWYQVSGTPAGTLFALANTEAGGFRVVFDGGNKFIIYTQGRSITTKSSSIISGSAGEWVFFAVSIDTTLATPGTSWVNAVKAYAANADSTGLSLIGNQGLTGSALLSASALGGIDRIILGNNNGTDAASYRALNSNALLDDIRLYDGVLDEAAIDAIRLQSIPEASASGFLAGIGALCVVLMSRRRSGV